MSSSSSSSLEVNNNRMSSNQSMIMESSDHPTSVGNSSTDDLVISARCYLKILMHAFHYPHSMVNGLLIMEKKKKSNKSSVNRLVDCIPLFHSGHGLAPMLEVALNQVYDYFHKNTNLVIGGYYQANEYFHELPCPAPDVFVERIMDKLNEIIPESVLFMLSDFNLATTIDNVDQLHLPLFMYTNVDGKLKRKTNNNVRGFQLENADAIYEAIQDLIFDKQYHLNLIDFDQHLENVQYDWRNIKMNKIIEKYEQPQQQ